MCAPGISACIQGSLIWLQASAFSATSPRCRRRLGRSQKLSPQVCLGTPFIYLWTFVSYLLSWMFWSITVAMFQPDEQQQGELKPCRDTTCNIFCVFYWSIKNHNLQYGQDQSTTAPHRNQPTCWGELRDGQKVQFFSAPPLLEPLSRSPCPSPTHLADPL